MKTADYSLYLVTDSTPPILGGRDLADVVADAIAGGVSIVQYRDKTSDTGHLITTAKRLHEVTRSHGVPLLINDRIDVALAVGCEGVHIGQDDIDLAAARKLLGDDAIIGVTAASIEEATAAARGGADYLGIGTVYATATKQNTKSIIGTSGVQSILSELSSIAPDIKTVCIGGINASNAQRILYQSASPEKALDGIAVVSAIVGAADPKQAAQELRNLVSKPPAFAKEIAEKPQLTHDLLQQQVPALVKKLADATPLCHNMTNIVVQNIAANVALAIGGSPIMASNSAEAPDLARLGGSLVINMGSLQPESVAHYTAALRAYNSAGGPVVFDPVGAGATAARREAVQTLLASGYFDLIKGNENEIATVAGAAGQQQQRGVDSGASTRDLREKAQLVRSLARRLRNVVFMTGVSDVVSDGERTYEIRNGHELLGAFTGSGCSLGTTIAAVLAVHRDDKLLAAIAAALLYEIAAERAAKKSGVSGPGTFVPAFLDELYLIRKESAAGNGSWATVAEVHDISGLAES